MSNRQVETERTYQLPDDAATLPDLSAADVVASVVDGGVHELEATYQDTPDLRLIRRGVTLRRRTGGADAGWHLKLPLGVDARQEVHWPLGDSGDLPDEVRGAVTALTDGRDLAPVVRLATSRHRSLLLDEAGQVLAELSDDRVHATRLDSSAGAQEGRSVTVWREVEVELVGGDVDDLDMIEAALERAGAERAAVQSKLARALGGIRVAARPAAAAELDQPTAGEVLSAYVASHLEALRWADVSLRLDVDGPGVHDVRVQSRRLRTALSAQRPLIEDQVTRHLEQELKLLGRVLSDVRDRQVATELLSSRLSDMAGDEAAQALVERMQHNATGQDRAEAGMRAALRSERYLRLLEGLDALARGEHLSELAAEPADAVLRQHVDKALRRVRKTGKRARRASGEERTEALHDLRKAAKRLRYTCELVEPVVGEPAATLGHLAKQVQTVLGDHLDRIALVSRVEALAAGDAVTARDAFLLGRLHAVLENEIQTAGPEQERALRRVRSAKATGWLD